MTQENENLSKENQQEKQCEVSADFKFIIAEKVGMTQVYNANGELKGVTVLRAGPCKVTYVRTKDNDGYNAVCLGFGHVKEKNIPSALKGVFSKNNLEPLKHLKEVRVEKTDGFAAGQTVSLLGRFNDGDWIDVQGVTIGKGFAGGMKRHNFSGQPASHGASDRERAPGGLASRRSLGRVMPGQRMAGHLGCEKVTVHKMQIVKVLPEKNLILVNGGVPGKEGSIVYVLKTVKRVPRPVIAQPKSKTKKEVAKTPTKKK